MEGSKTFRKSERTDFKSQRIRICTVRKSSIYDREVALMRSLQRGYLNKLLTMSIPVDMPIWMEKIYKALPIRKRYRKLMAAKTGKCKSSPDMSPLISYPIQNDQP